ncbi:MAG: hypothetical protein IKG93_07725 [Clostridiales bacterium]|nr:hypothetical protein [Clostridiales bacterium]
MKTKKTVVGICLIFLVMLAAVACRSNTKGSKKEKTPQEQTEALLDDFCAFLKSGKYDKMAPLTDPPCKMLDKLKEYSRSEVSGILDTSLKELSYKIESIEEVDGGTKAKVVFTYFDTTMLVGRSDEVTSTNEVVSLIKNAENIEIECEVKCGPLASGEAWRINGDDAETMCQVLFGYIEKLQFGTQATESTTALYFIPFSVYECVWYDEKYNELPGLHESTRLFRTYMVTWDYYNNVTVRYEFVDSKDNVLYSGETTLMNRTDIIEIELKPKEKLPLGILTCKVYDPADKCFVESQIEVFKDGYRIPVEFHFTNAFFVDETGEQVTKYEFGTQYIAVKLVGEYDTRNLLFNYEIYAVPEENDETDTTAVDPSSTGSSETVPGETVASGPIYKGELKLPEGQDNKDYLLVVEPQVAETLPGGKYIFVIYDMFGNEYKKLEFEIEGGETVEGTTESTSAVTGGIVTGTTKESTGSKTTKESTKTKSETTGKTKTNGDT